MKKTTPRALLLLVLCLSLVLSPVNVFYASAEFSQRAQEYTTGINAAVAYDVTNQNLLYKKAENEKIAPASLTKLVTALVALKYVSPDEVFTVGSELSFLKPESSVCRINKGQKLKLKDFIDGMLITSGSDAAYTVAVNVARKVAKNTVLNDDEAVKHFCRLMNSYCVSLGAENTHFVNPDGWDAEDSYTTASDLIKISLEVLENGMIKSIIDKSEKTCLFDSGESITWTNTNELLNENSEYYYKYCKGIKTGTTSDAGKCITAIAEKNGREILVIAMGCKTNDDRFARVADLFELAFSSPVKGDADTDGDITAADARLVLRCSVRLEVITSVIFARGDIDSDGKITASDARSILRCAVGLEKI